MFRLLQIWELVTWEKFKFWEFYDFSINTLPYVEKILLLGFNEDEGVKNNQMGGHKSCDLQPQIGAPPPKITAYKLYLPLRKFNNGVDP